MYDTNYGYEFDVIRTLSLFVLLYLRIFAKNIFCDITYFSKGLIKEINKILI